MRRSPVIFLPIVTVLIGVGGSLLIASGWHTRSLVQPIPDGVTTTGQVVMAISDYAPRGGTAYAPIVQFRDRSGNLHQVRGPSTLSGSDVGRAARVSYDPANPTHAHDLSDSADGWQVAFFVGLGVTALGVTTTILAALLIVRDANYRREFEALQASD